jgi:hypothetical protein
VNAKSSMSRETPILRPVGGALSVITTVALIAWLRWWSLIIAAPLNLILIYAFFWPGVRRR